MLRTPSWSHFGKLPWSLVGIKETVIWAPSFCLKMIFHSRMISSKAIFDLHEYYPPTMCSIVMISAWALWNFIGPHPPRLVYQSCPHQFVQTSLAANSGGIPFGSFPFNRNRSNLKSSKKISKLSALIPHRLMPFTKMQMNQFERTLSYRTSAINRNNLKPLQVEDG